MNEANKAAFCEILDIGQLNNSPYNSNPDFQAKNIIPGETT